MLDLFQALGKKERLRESWKIFVSGLHIESAVFLSRMFPMLSGPDAEDSLREDSTFLTLSSLMVILRRRASVRNVKSGRGGASASGCVLHWLAK